jgi:hypothetical protein
MKTKKVFKGRKRSRELKANRIMLRKDPLVESLTQVRSMLDENATPIVPDLLARIDEGDEPFLGIVDRSSPEYSVLMIMDALEKKNISDDKREELHNQLKRKFSDAKAKKYIEKDEQWLIAALMVKDYLVAGEICLALNKFYDAEQYLTKSGMEPADACRMLGEHCMSKKFYMYAASFFRKSGDKDKADFAKAMNTHSAPITEFMKEDALNENEP